jgi:hypothetical protein
VLSSLGAAIRIRIVALFVFFAGFDPAILPTAQHPNDAENGLNVGEAWRAAHKRMLVEGQIA